MTSPLDVAQPPFAGSGLVLALVVIVALVVLIIAVIALRRVLKRRQ